jgi:hypothetical protein
VLELSRQEDSDQDLEDTSLHGNDGDDTEDGALHRSRYQSNSKKAIIPMTAEK